MVCAGGGQWSVSDVVDGQCFAFLLVGGWFLFLRMVGGHIYLISIWSMVGGSWSVVCGLWSVAGRWAVVFYYAKMKFVDPVNKTYPTVEVLT